MFCTDRDLVARSYENARTRFKAWGIDTDEVIRRFYTIPISLHNWQGDDVTGFENQGDVASQNMVTGNYPGRARNAQEMRSDIEAAFSVTPTRPRVNLHSMYSEPGTTDRSLLTTEDFRGWIDWCKEKGWALDFNVSFFTHPKMRNGFSLASQDKATRDFWIRAGKGGREISRDIGAELGEPCINNIWVPDGFKDIPADRFEFRRYLADSLDQILEVPYDRTLMMDVLEGKLFGIGVESYTVGSHEFYLGYAAKKGIGVTMDTGHYRPAEDIADKISSVIPFVDPLMLHISRGIHWDSDHVLIQGDAVTSWMEELVRGDLLDSGKVYMGLDFFDASINRVFAWAIGLRAAGKALLTAMLEPYADLKKAEQDEDFTLRLALTDEMRNLPVNAVWDYACMQAGKPVGAEWIDILKKYEADVTSKRI